MKIVFILEQSREALGITKNKSLIQSFFSFFFPSKFFFSFQAA